MLLDRLNTCPAGCSLIPNRRRVLGLRSMVEISMKLPPLNDHELVYTFKRVEDAFEVASLVVSPLSLFAPF